MCILIKFNVLVELIANYKKKSPKKKECVVIESKSSITGYALSDGTFQLLMRLSYQHDFNEVK